MTGQPAAAEPVNVSYFGTQRRRRLVEKAKRHNLCGCEGLPMTIETRTASHRTERIDGTEPAAPPIREETRPARGLIVGLILSTMFWLSLLVLWLAL